MTQEELARASDLRSASISDYERGVIVPELRTLQRLLQAMGFSLSAIEATEQFVRRIRSGSFGDTFSHGEPPGSSCELAAVLAEFGRVAEKLVQTSLLVVSRHEAASDETTAPLQDEATGGAAVAAPAPLKPVPDLWESLKKLSPQAQRKLVSTDSSFRNPALSLFLCRESITLAGRNPHRALATAELAVEVARSIPGATRLVGYAEVHRANAFRVQGDLPAAERILSEGEGLLGAAEAGDPEDDAVIYALKASLRRSQGRLQEALEFHDRALGRPGASGMRSELLASKAYTLDEAGDLAGMVTALQEAVQSLRGCLEIVSLGAKIPECATPATFLTSNGRS
jgi:transcriptional regulator with XRE-family HTH domain